jgi:hypothetical protein
MARADRWLTATGILATCVSAAAAQLGVYWLAAAVNLIGLGCGVALLRPWDTRP